MLLPGRSTCVLSPDFTTNGVLKENFFFAFVLRGVRHTVLPVCALSAITKGFEAPSQLKISFPFTNTGVPPLP